MAGRLVTVALAGDGGDETFLGYDRYRAVSLAAWHDRVPAPLRRAAARVVGILPDGGPRSLSHRLRRFGGALGLEPRRRYGRWLTGVDPEETARLYTPEFAAEVGGRDSLALLDAAYAASDAPTFVEATAHADTLLYLPDDLLVKMDIAGMAPALEVRSPFLDHRVAEFAASLPAALKLSAGSSRSTS